MWFNIVIKSIHRGWWFHKICLYSKLKWAYLPLHLVILVLKKSKQRFQVHIFSVSTVWGSVWHNTPPCYIVCQKSTVQSWRSLLVYLEQLYVVSVFTLVVLSVSYFTWALHQNISVQHTVVPKSDSSADYYSPSHVQADYMHFRDFCWLIFIIVLILTFSTQKHQYGSKSSTKTMTMNFNIIYQT